MANKHDLTIGIDGDPKGFDAAARSAEESAKAFDRELGKLERELAMAEQRTKATADAIKKYGSESNKAALEAKKLGDAAEKAGRRAERAQKQAADAAEKLAAGEGDAARATELAAHAEDAVEHAAIKAAEAHRAAARAADEQAQQERQLARDIQLAAAASHLAALREAGDTKSYNSALLNLRKTHGDLAGTAVASFKEIENKGSSAYQALTKAGEGVASAGPMWVVPAANAIAALPLIAAVAGDGITLGLGAGLAGLGLFAQAGSADVKRTFSKLRKDVGSDLREISTPFHATWLHIAADARSAFGQLKPSLQKAFAEMAPATSRFSGTLAASIDSPRVQGAITSVGHSFSVILDDFGPALGGTIGDIADGVKSISDAAASNPGALSGLVTDVGQLTKYTLEGIGALIKYKTEVDGVVHAVAGMGPAGFVKFIGQLHDGTNALLGNSHSMQVASGTFPTFGAQATAAAAATGHLMTSQQAAALSADLLKTSMDALTGKALTSREAMYQYRKSVDEMAASLKANGHAHGFNSVKGAENEHALDKMAIAAQAAAQGMKADGKGAKEVSGFLEGARQRIIATAEKMHYSASEAKALADKLLGVTHAANTIPKSKKTQVTAATSGAMSNLDRFLAKVNRIPTRRQLMVDVRYNGVRPDLQATGGYWTPKKYAKGDEVSGLLRGPGTGTSDSIPMPMLSNGEFIVNAQSTAANRDILEAINSGHQISMGSMTAPRPVSAAGVRGGDGAQSRPFGAVRVEWVGGNAGDDLMKWLRSNIRVVAGGGTDSVQRALGG